MRRPPRLAPVGAREPGVLAETRLRQAWPFIVGPALTQHTRPLKVQRDVLVMGCWDHTRIALLREATAAVWPQIRERIQRAVGLRLMALQVVPCDPPQETPTLPRDPDSLRGALNLLKARHDERVRLGLEADTPDAAEESWTPPPDMG